MACRLFSAEPLLEPLMSHGQWQTHEDSLMDFYSKFRYDHTKQHRKQQIFGSVSLLAVYILSDVNTFGVEHSFNKRQNVGTKPLTQSLLVYRKAINSIAAGVSSIH